MTTLIVWPDGVLHQMPWCVLPGIKENYWIEELTVSTIPSVQSFVAKPTTR